MAVKGTKHYFVADVHLGLRMGDVREREHSFVQWLHTIASDAAAIYLLGDIFDFWWEYQYVVPKGHVRVLGTLAQLVDAGVAVHFFTGNHDRWSFGYLEEEVGVHVHHKPLLMQIGDRRFYMGHGDGYGSQVVWERMFASRFLQRCFGAVHPRWGVDLGYRWSAGHRIKYNGLYVFNEETDPLCRFACAYPHPVDYFVFGHLHIPVDIVLPHKARLVVLGEWMPYGQYGVFDKGEETFEIKSLSL